MRCPSCKSIKVATYDSRRVESVVVRKRKCLSCDERFYTLEQYMTADELDDIQEIRRINGAKVLYDVPDDAAHRKWGDTKERQRDALDMPELSEVSESDTKRTDGSR